jgi:hypothetical protein
MSRLDNEEQVLTYRLDDLLMRRAKKERVTDLVNFDRVRGFLRTIYWRRKFLAHRDEQRRVLNGHGEGKFSRTLPIVAHLTIRHTRHCSTAHSIDPAIGYRWKPIRRRTRPRSIPFTSWFTYPFSHLLAGVETIWNDGRSHVAFIIRIDTSWDGPAIKIWQPIVLR